jgi:hypothetical protein
VLPQVIIEPNLRGTMQTCPTVVIFGEPKTLANLLKHLSANPLKAPLKKATDSAP